MLAMVLTIAPIATRADDSSTAAARTSVANESVVAAPSDTPLIRQAKLRRSWTVFREAESSQIWAITTDKQKREIQTLDFFTAFDANYLIKLVGVGRLDEFTTGDPITSVDGLDPMNFRKAAPPCRLVKSEEHPAVHLVCGAKRRVIIREGVFHQFGWEFRDVETVPQDQIDVLEEEDPLDEQTTFEEDIEVQATENRQLRDRLTQRLELQGKLEERLRLVKSIDHPEVFVITPDGIKRHVRDMDAVRSHGLDLQAVTEVTDDEIAAFPEGAPIVAAPPEPVVSEEPVTGTVEGETPETVEPSMDTTAPAEEEDGSANTTPEDASDATTAPADPVTTQEEPSSNVETETHENTTSNVTTL